MMLPHQTRDLALYYALRWLGKHSCLGRAVQEDEITPLAVHFQHVNGKRPSASVWIDETVYAWNEYLIVETPSVEETSGNLIVLHTSGATKTFPWKVAPQEPVDRSTSDKLFGPN